MHVRRTLPAAVQAIEAGSNGRATRCFTAASALGYYWEGTPSSNSACEGRQAIDAFPSTGRRWLRRFNVTTFLRQFNVATFLRRFNEALSRAKEIPQCQEYHHQRARKDEEKEKSSEYGLIVLVVTRGIDFDQQRRVEKEDRNIGKRDAQRAVGSSRLYS